MQTFIYRTPIKGRLVLMAWGALLGLAGFAVLQLWRTALAFAALLGWGLLLSLAWWRNRLFFAEVQSVLLAPASTATKDKRTPRAQMRPAAYTTAPTGITNITGTAGTTSAQRCTLTLHRGLWVQAACCIPCHCIFADALLSTPLLRLADCRLLVYYTAGHTFVLPPLATAQATALALQCRQ